MFFVNSNLVVGNSMLCIYDAKRIVKLKLAVWDTQEFVDTIEILGSASLGNGVFSSMKVMLKEVLRSRILVRR